MRRGWRTGVMVWVVLMLAACGSDSLEDLREFSKSAHADRKPRVEPLPELKPQEVFAYNPATLADPFAPQNIRPARGAKAGGGESRPDLNRRKDPLEEYPLDALKMAGTLSRGKQTWAVVQAPDGTVHRVKAGDHLGQNFGTVIRISDDKVDLVELTQGPAGDWVEREASLTLTE